MIAFTWQRGTGLATTSTVMEGVRLLDAAAPGDNLMDSTWIVRSDAVDSTIQSALITPGGRDVLVATSRNIASEGNNGTAVVQILEIQAASGKPVGVLRTRTARYNTSPAGQAA